MLIARRSLWGFRVLDAYFGDYWSLPLPKGDIVFGVQAPRNGPGASPFHTLHIDLTLSVEGLLAGVGRNNRYKLNRAEQRDGILPEFDDRPSDASIAAFVEYYDIFARQRQLPRCNRARLVALGDVDGVTLTRARDQEGHILGEHAYVVDGHRARLLYSASFFRDETVSGDRSRLGRANRFLHFREFIHFKDRGFSVFDFGGLALSNNPERASIDAFKLSFGGRHVTEYNAWIGRSTMGRLALKLLDRGVEP